MPLVIQNTRDLVDPKNFKLKVLVFGLYGAGKTTFLSTAPDLGLGVCETGFGKGALSVAGREIDYVDLKSYEDFDTFASGGVFKEKASKGLDSLSDMVRTFIKDKALSLPRAKGESLKRALGVPELDDYNVMAELTRKLLRKLLDQPQHIVVTAGLKVDKPQEESPMAGDTLIGPDLAGQMFLGSTAMFDLVLCLKTRSKLKDPKDAKSRYTERYFVTENNGSGILAKNRLSVAGGKSFLPSEVIFDPETGEGSVPYFIELATKTYQKYLDEKAATAPTIVVP